MAQFHQATAAGRVEEGQLQHQVLEAMSLPQHQEQPPVVVQELEEAAGVEVEQLLVRLLEPLIRAVPAEVVQLVGLTPGVLQATSWVQYPHRALLRLNRPLAD